MQTVNEIMAEELNAASLEVEFLADHEQIDIERVTTQLDAGLPGLAESPYALRVLAAALRSYARVAEQYAAGLEARDG